MMTIYSLIKDFASVNKGCFRLKQFRSYLSKMGLAYSQFAIRNAVKKLVDEGSLERDGRGIYKITQTIKRVFLPDFPEGVSDFYKKLKPFYPFADICIWKFDNMAYFTRHVPAVNFFIVEVEKDVIDAISDKIQALKDDYIVLKNPSKKEMMQFVSFRNLVVVKTLVSRSPVIKTEQNVFPLLEKILVDVLCDDTFYMLHGIESLYIYQKAFDLYNIDEAKLLSYARRRNKQKEVKSLLEDKEYDFS